MNKKILSIIMIAIMIIYSIINAFAKEDLNSPKPSPSVNQNNSFIKINETVEINNDINITLILDNISYDNSNNSLEKINTDDVEINNVDEGISFDYCINCSSLKTITLNYKLGDTIEVGDNITFNAYLINKDNEEEYMTYRSNVLVIEEAKKEENQNEEENNKQRTNFSQRSSGSSTNYSSSIKSSSGSNASTNYKGSSNNYLSNITIKGYKLNKTFLKERLTYFVTVPNNVKSLNISVSKESSKASVNISGNSNFSIGLNKVIIKVTSEDNRVKNYRIYVTRLDSDTSEE